MDRGLVSACFLAHEKSSEGRTSLSYLFFPFFILMGSDADPVLLFPRKERNTGLA